MEPMSNADKEKKGIIRGNNPEYPHVNMEEIVKSKEFRNNQSNVCFVVGNKVETGEPVIADLNELQHLLFAGGLGSSATVFLHSIITSIMAKSTPEEVKFLIIEEGVMDLYMFRNIPYLMMPIIHDPRKAFDVLKWVKPEIEARKCGFKSMEVDSIEGFNRLSSHKLPHVIIIIYGLTNLMGETASETESIITEIVNVSKNTGVHLIIGTQQPNSDTITKQIRTCMPTRISFATEMQEQSVTILSRTGAERLNGHGDMLYWPAGIDKPMRVQGRYTSTKEVEDMINQTVNGNGIF